MMGYRNLICAFGSVSLEQPWPRRIVIIGLQLFYFFCLWSDKLHKETNPGNLMSLERSHVFLKHKEEDYHFDNAFGVLCSICRVKVLIISEDTTKAYGKLHIISYHQILDLNIGSKYKASTVWQFKTSKAKTVPCNFYRRVFAQVRFSLRTK